MHFTSGHKAKYRYTFHYTIIAFVVNGNLYSWDFVGLPHFQCVISQRSPLRDSPPYEIWKNCYIKPITGYSNDHHKYRKKAICSAYKSNWIQLVKITWNTILSCYWNWIWRNYTSTVQSDPTSEFRNIKKAIVNFNGNLLANIPLVYNECNIQLHFL
jgi:hypothetical protein